MKMVTSKTVLDNNLSQNNLHDASFASYLNHGEDNFCFMRLEGSTRNSASFISTPEGRLYIGKKKVEDEEIDVFDADKYFNGSMDVDTNSRISSSRGVVQYEHDLISNSPDQDKPKTEPSIYSESSWNSQKMLLHGARGNEKQRKPKKGFLAKIGCRCYCSDTSSVEVVSNQSRDLVQPKSITQIEMKRQAGKPDIASVRARLNDVDVERKISMNNVDVERKLSMLKWGIEAAVHETESDASSDLFEIESLSTNPNCYAPSEASIEWSVVTASVADYSIMSDSEESVSQARGKQIQHRRLSGNLLGCKSHKSVRIAGNGNGINQNSAHRFQSFKHNTKFQSENRHIGFD